MQIKDPNKTGYPDTKLLILLLGMGLILRLFFALHSHSPVIKDGIVYDSVAVSLINGHGFSLDGQRPTAEVPPLYPYFLASIYGIFGHNLKIALIFQALMGTLVCFLAYKIAGEVFKDRVIAFCALLISSFNYFLIREGERLWTEPLFIFMLMLSTFYYIRLRDTRRVSFAVLFGLSFSGLVLTRGIALFLPFIFILFELMESRSWQGRNFLGSTKHLIVALAVFIVPLGLWAGRNLVVQKQFILVASNGGRNFYEGFNPYENNKFGITVVDETIKKGEAIPSEIERDKFYFEEGLKSIFRKSKLELLRLTLLKGLTFWSPIDWGAMGNGGAVFNFCTSFILPFSLVALVWVRRNKLALICFLMPICYFFFFSLVFMGLPRFRLPVEPFLVILASYGIVSFFRKVTNKVIPLFVILAWLGLNLILFINSAYTKELFKKIANLSGIW